MQFVKDIFTQTLEVKQSKFIAYLTPYSKYEETLQKLKKQHPKARHFVVAFRYLNEFSQIVEHSSDDGEPKGTSGKPSLMVLQGKELINTAVIIVRYFGGTKLGTGGLVRAYSDAVNLVIESSEFVEYKKQELKTLEVNYTDSRVIEYECELSNITIKETIYLTNISYTLEASSEDMENFFKNLDIRNIKYKIQSNY